MKFEVNSQRFELGAIPGCCGHFTVAGFKVDRVQFMGHDTAAEFVSHCLGPSGMIEVTVGQQKIFELRIPRAGIRQYFSSTVNDLVRIRHR